LHICIIFFIIFFIVFINLFENIRFKVYFTMFSIYKIKISKRTMFDSLAFSYIFCNRNVTKKRTLLNRRATTATNRILYVIKCIH
ncbi:hypothetical protein GLOIN_2v1738988, partial [Rhizophagus irregularis DAOM 181602=DAOM 197198]